MAPKKKLKTQEEFQVDILKVTSEQEKKIDSFIGDMGVKMDELVTTMQGIAQSIQSQPSKSVEESLEVHDIYAVLLIPENPIPQEDLNKKAGEVAQLIKPIMKKYQIKTLNCSVKK